MAESSNVIVRQKHRDRCQSKVQVEKYEMTWEYENFSCNPAGKNDVLQSRPFPSNPASKIAWKVLLYPHGTMSSRDYVNIRVKLLTDTVVRAKYKISILNEDGEAVHEVIEQLYHDFKKDSTRGFCTFISRDALFKSDFLANDKLVIHCEIWEFLKESCRNTAVQPEFNIPEFPLMRKLGTMVENNEFSDVVIKIQKEKFPAHKMVLSASSPVFAVMFEHNMSEKANHIVKITDIKPDVFRYLLKFMYTGELTAAIQDVDIARSIFFAADKYDIQRLKVLCEKGLFDAVTVENVSEILIVAHMHSADQLRTQVINYISNNANEVMKTPGWKGMIEQWPKLFGEVYTALMQIVQSKAIS